MNYYERHIGDYLKDTSHLSLVEHGVYTRLLDVYYTREGAIPEADAARLIGARTPAEKSALKAVLAEFFVLRDHCWHQGRCDTEIARFKDKQAKAKRSAEARWSGMRHASDGNANADANASPDAMRTHSEGNAPRARPQSPVTSNQTQRESAATSETVAPVPPDPPEPDTTGHSPTAAGAVCKAMRQAGLQQTNPGDPRLLAMLQQGATLDEFVGLATEAAKATPPKGWAWVLVTLQNRRTEAAAITLAPPVQPKPATVESRAADETADYLAQQRMTPEQQERAREAARLARASIGRSA
jgi:uncharacterized protein YdaU (DUF1376 family)